MAPGGALPYEGGFYGHGFGFAYAEEGAPGAVYGVAAYGYFYEGFAWCRGCGVEVGPDAVQVGLEPGVEVRGFEVRAVAGDVSGGDVQGPA